MTCENSSIDFVLLSPLLLLFSGFIVTPLGAKMFSILHILFAGDDVTMDVDEDAGAGFEADTGPLLVLLLIISPVPVRAFFGHGQLVV